MRLVHLFITVCTFIICNSLFLVHAQQSYIADPEAACNSSDVKNIYYGYSCNEKITCDTKLTFRSQSPYDTVSKIASLLGVHPDLINQANQGTNAHDVVESSKLLHVPVTCKCPDNDIFYDKVPTTTYPVASNDKFYDIAHNKYQGLTTCRAIKYGNTDKDFPVLPNTKINIPLRCACPTVNQKSDGIESLITYVVGKGDTISTISTQLKVDNKSILQANNLEEDSNIYPFTTLLIPAMNINSASKPSSSTLSNGAIGGIVAAACAALLAFGGAAVKFNLCGSMFNCFNSTVVNYNDEKKKTMTEEPKIQYEKMSRNATA